jgi:FOG: GGDEF domain
MDKLYGMTEIEILKENLNNYGKLLEEIGGEVWELNICHPENIKDEDFIKYSFNYQTDMVLKFDEKIHEEDLCNLNKNLENFIKSDDDKIEFIYRQKEEKDKYKWVYSRGIKVFNEKGKLEKIIGIRSDITEKIIMKEAIFKLSHFDTLTNLSNKEKLKEDFSHVIKKNNKEDIAFLYIDIDDFRHVNNVLGYSFGDEFLKKFSDFLKQEFGKDNLIGRLNADEFLVIYNNYKDINSLEKMIEKFLKDLRKKIF